MPKNVYNKSVAAAMKLIAAAEKEKISPIFHGFLLQREQKRFIFNISRG
jgi:hypothetical protein